ncbi:hypothetical protein RMR10_010030 [Agrobacterium rosae]|uniref:hypothetical protein n=1 Tax=Agrobacterium rosae TaxID=1972867 RepID=UPI002A1461C4|nr:hypothetical protein [Agrobacterium rosae]MDX8312959.1 hypothetical protein [Agrobacterium rosae]
MPKVDWKQAPKGARWWAVDANGDAHWFMEPDIAAFTDFWFSVPVDAPTFEFDGDWRSSLTERPAKIGIVK